VIASGLPTNRPVTSRVSYWAFKIKIASLADVPRATASWVPSGDQAKEKISSDWKSVNCLGELPSRGWLHRFDTPLRFSM
jgi:hypothetical protein